MPSVLLKLLRIFHLARRYIGRVSSRLALFIAILGRKLSEWWRTWPGKPGPSRNTKPAESSRLGNGPDSVSGGTRILKEYVIAASDVPASASQRSPRIQIDAEPQPATPSPRPMPITLPVERSHSPNPSYLHAGSFASPSSSNLSTVSSQSRASDRLSRITSSRESLHATVGRPAELPRSPHHQFGRGPNPSRSGGRLSRLSRSPSPMPHSNTTQPHHLDVVHVVPTHAHASRGMSPTDSPQLESLADFPSSSSNTQELQSAESNRERQKTTSLDVHIQNPSLENLTIGLPTHLQPLTEEPMVISPTQPSVLDHSETASQRPSFAGSEFYLPEGRFLQLIQSEQVPRYTKNVTISRDEKPYTVDPLTTTFPYFVGPERSDQTLHEQSLNPWTPATHPDGALYFYDRKRRLFTDTNMHDQILREEMEDFYRALQKILRDDQLTIPSKNYDLVLDIMPDGSWIKWSYYYACHESRCLFWLEPYDASYMLSELYGVDCPAHVKHRMEDLYWNHWSLFPVAFEGRRLPPDVYDELMGVLVHGCVDMMTSKTSTLPYDDDKMQKMITLVEKVKDAKGSEEYYIAGATRLLSFFARWKFLHFHGQMHARLMRDKTAYDKPKRERSIFISLLSPLLFLTPEVHLREMEKLWTDDIIIESVWKRFMSKLLSEWNDLILWSAVMLAVSVGFFAVPGVILYNINDNSTLKSMHQVVILTSSAEIATALSVEASIGSIVIGMFLVRHNRSKQEASPTEAIAYLDENCGTMIGLEPMAIIFSLPWALLMWSMVTFSFALLCFSFVISNLGTRITVGLTSGIVVALTMLCLRTAWGSSNAWRVWWDGFLPSLRALKYDRTSHGVVGRLRSFVMGVVESLPLHNRPSSHRLDGAGNVQSSTGP